MTTSEVKLLAPLPRPRSLRDFYAFEQHIATARAHRGQSVPPNWYKFPVFYFGNHQSIAGPDDPIALPHTEQLDYELEVACVIGREARNIEPDEAAELLARFADDFTPEMSGKFWAPMGAKSVLGRRKGVEADAGQGDWECGRGVGQGGGGEGLGWRRRRGRAG